MLGKMLDQPESPFERNTATWLAPFSARFARCTQLVGSSIDNGPCEMIMCHPRLMGQYVPLVKDNMSRDQAWAFAHKQGMTSNPGESQFNEELGARIKRLRIGAGLTQKGVAQALNVPEDRYKKYENRSAFPPYLIAPFARLVGQTAEYILLGGPERAGAQSPGPWLPKPETISALLAAAMHVDEEDFEKRGELLDVANAVHIGLRWISEDPATEDDAGFQRAVRRRVAEIVDERRLPSSRDA